MDNSISEDGICTKQNIDSQTFPHIALYVRISYVLGMKFESRLSPERYLANKEYFDQSLIAALENQVELNERLKFKISVYEAKAASDRHTITALTAKCKDLKAQIYTLLKKEKAGSEDISRLEDEIKKIQATISDEIENRDKTINDLLEYVKKLEKENEELRRKERKRTMADTTNTNNPTGTYRFDDAVKDKKRNPKNSREVSGRKRGGQPGHRSTRVSVQQKCDHIYEIHVKKAPKGAQPVYDEHGKIKYYCAQVKDARFVTEVNEYHFIPDENGITLSEQTMKRFRINPVIYSNHLKSQVLYLQSKGVVSLNRLCTILNELSLGELNITEGSVVNWMKEFNEQSAQYRSYILQQILKSWLVHADETGYKINGKQAWIHVMCTKDHAYFVMTEKRKDTEKGPLKLLEGFLNILMHDHYLPYYDLKCFHAECNAHILRYLQAGVDFDEILECLEMIGLLKKALKRKEELIAEGINEITDEEYEEFKTEYVEIIERILAKYEPKYKDVPAKYIPDALKTLRRMKTYVNEHLLFLKDFDVEFTNNAGERQCRVVKAHKKISGQCLSIETAEYLTSLLTVIQTANLQGINTLKLMNDIMSGRWTAPEENSDARLLL